MMRPRTPRFVSFSLPVSLTIALSITFLASSAMAQTGSIEFAVHVTPSSGVSEPVRQFPFYLLSKSFADVQAEAEATERKLDLSAFVDKLDVSKELKAWMKKNNTVALSGEDFVNGLSVNDVMSVPEFLKAYVDRNAGDQSINFPSPKYKPHDEEKNPERYQKLRQEYLDSIRKFLTANPDSKSGMDLNLDSIDPGPTWRTESAKRDPALKRRALELAQTRYLVAKAETDLDGRGNLHGISPGTYWIGTLDIYVTVGDARLRWDVPVRVSAGGTSRVELTNSNAAQPRAASP
ncbi:MAG TPA: hypothetical protein VEJ39_10020 [Candidatus Acidoferrales bacterium]|nr:hypothetical protein [Candidatus Acidoferrales bacterium]